MSMSETERASFLIGEAIRRLLENPEAPAARHKLI